MSEEKIAPEVEKTEESVAGVIAAIVCCLLVAAMVAGFGYLIGKDDGRTERIKFEDENHWLFTRFIPEVSWSMSKTMAEAHAATVSGRLMECFGAEDGWQCHPRFMGGDEDLSKPVVTCFGTCQVVSR